MPSCYHHQIHGLCDTYLEEPLKECERIRRLKECDSLEFVQLYIEYSTSSADGSFVGLPEK